MKSGFAIVKKSCKEPGIVISSLISWAVGRAGAGHGRSEEGRAVPALLSAPGHRGAQRGSPLPPVPLRDVSGQLGEPLALTALGRKGFVESSSLWNAAVISSPELITASHCFPTPSTSQCISPGFSRVFHALPVLGWDEDHTVTGGS